MSNPAAGGGDRDETGGAARGGAVQDTAHAFRAALSESTPAQQPVDGTANNALPDMEPAVAPAVAEAAPEPEASRPPSAVLGGSRVEEQAAEPALDRPGAPLLAGAAIAGALLVIAPFAVITGTSTAALDTTAQQLPLVNQPGGDGEGQTTQASGDSVPAAPEGGNGTPVTESASEPGFVPEVQSGSADPSLPDPGTVGASGSIETSAPVAQGGAPEAPDAQNDVREAGGTEGGPQEDGASGAAEATGATAPDDASEGAGDTGAASDTADSESSAATAGGESPPSVEEEGAGDAGAEASAEEEAGADASTDAEAFSADAAAAPDPPLSGAEPPESSSILQEATEGVVSVEDRYLALVGPDCVDSEESFYNSEGRWESAEGTASWATRPGGYGQENCQGSYEAIPVSGDPDQGDHQSASWTFSPGAEGSVCEIYVHVPDDESPLWVASGETTYRIHPGSDTSEPTVAVFGFDQSQVRGGWVQVTGFASPTETFTVHLTNAGEDSFPDEEHTNAHVAASAMRADCS